MAGKRQINSMDWDGAIESFEKALQSNPKNAAAHLELGLLYDNRKTNWAAAVYHYEKHLALRPNSSVGDVVKDHILECKRKLARTVSFKIVTGEVQKELERYAQTNAMLMSRLEMLQNELARRPMYVTNYVTNFVNAPAFEPNDRAVTRPAIITESVRSQPRPEPERVVEDREEESKPEQRAAHAPRETARNTGGARSQPVASRARESKPKPAPAAKPKMRTHTVRPGETMSVVARKYGISVHALQQANPGVKGTRAGQRLNIPSK